MKTEPVKVGVIRPRMSLGELIVALEALRLECSMKGYKEPRVDQMVLEEDGDLYVYAKRNVGEE